MERGRKIRVRNDKKKKYFTFQYISIHIYFALLRCLKDYIYGVGVFSEKKLKMATKIGCCRKKICTHWG